jgi:hypothetical protein
LSWKLKETILKVLAIKEEREIERERERNGKGIKLYLIGHLKLLLN